MSRYLIYILLLLATASCVSNKKVVLLQKEDVNKNNMPLDTVTRKYTLNEFKYKIQTNDVLWVRFESLTPEKFDFLSKGQQQTGGGQSTGGAGLQLQGELVDQRGEIAFPVIGKVKVSGLSLFEVRDTLQHFANLYLEAPVVKVRLINYRVTILGEVNAEGTFVLSNNRVTLLEAISMAGFSEFADRSNVKLIRQKGNDTEVVYVNLLSEEFMNSPYYYVNQNDVIIVPALKQRPFQKYFTQNLALIASTISLVIVTLSLTR